MFKYRNYIAKLEVDADADVLHGRVLNIGDVTTGDVITFQGKTVREAEQAFHRAVDAYIEFCKEQGKEPDKPFSGKLPFRTTPEIHRDIYIAATREDRSINAWMEDILSQAARQDNNSPTTISENRQELEISLAEYENLLAQLHQKIMQLQNIIEPYLEEKTPRSFALLFKKIKPLLKDKELPELLDKVEVVQERLKSVQHQGAALLNLMEQPESNPSALEDAAQVGHQNAVG
jgi:predicted HicB family RNase H-like nuclease